MHILVIGGGGREHALAWKLRQSPRVKKLTCAPGNPGMAALGDCVAADVKDVKALADLAARIKAYLTVVGPEVPLVAGVADEFEGRLLRLIDPPEAPAEVEELRANVPGALIGPRKAAAELEGSKVFAKEFMKRHGIPTAGFTACWDPADAYTALCAVEWPVVIKADGLAAGKGVRIADTPDEATAILEAFMEKGELGPAGDKVVIEEYLEGQELSFIVLTDGETALPLAPTRDYKRAFDGDAGPNTGGMGAYSDDGILDAALREHILREIVQPTLRGLEKEGHTYQGFLYFGLMLTTEGPKVLEYNCRMGDPECQPLMVRLESDLAEALEKLSAGKLTDVQLKWSAEASVCVVLASKGYPGSYETGKVITGIEGAEKLDGVNVFHAGTKRADGGLVTNGGRVLGVTARGKDRRAAVKRAYAAVEKIQFDGMHFRRDIGKK